LAAPYDRFYAAPKHAIFENYISAGKSFVNADEPMPFGAALREIPVSCQPRRILDLKCANCAH